MNNHDDDFIYNNFSKRINNLHHRINGKFAVGVSGGPDSMALSHMLNRYAKENDAKLYAVTIDHDLRKESATEAQTVSEIIAKWSHSSHFTLKWEGKKPATRIMETARQARFELFEKFCKQHEINSLFLAHHRDDQFETFITRLSKGSGIDGLAGIKAEQNFHDLTIIRPMLNTGKNELIKYCQNNDIEYIRDPTNKDEKYLRPRIRKIARELESEGLSSARISKLSHRISRASTALDYYAEILFKESASFDAENNKYIIDGQKLLEHPDEIKLRVFQKAIKKLKRKDGNDLTAYPPRLEKLENLVGDILPTKKFQRRTLGGIIFTVRPKNQEITITPE